MLIGLLLGLCQKPPRILASLTTQSRTLYYIFIRLWYVPLSDVTETYQYAYKYYYKYYSVYYE